MNKRHYNSEETRQVIAEKAAQLFAQKGFAGTSIADISRESGFSKGHIYYHFENKEKLFVHLSLETMRNWGEKWKAVAGSYPTSVEKLYGMAYFVMNNYKTPLLPVGQELAMNPNTSPETLQALQGLAATPMAAYAEIFREGVENGEFAIENLEETTLLFGSWMGTLCQFTLTMDGEPLQRLFQQAVTIFVGGIRKREDT